MSEETALWAWFLFRSGLGLAQAKAVLARLERGERLATLLPALRRDPRRWGLTPAQAARLHPPSQPTPVSALRWDEAAYPASLRRLPLERRPALLFYRGDPQVLRGPLCLFDEAPPADEGLLDEALALLLDEWPTAAVWGSRAAERLVAALREMSGTAILFVRQGLATFEPPAEVGGLVEEGRLLLLSFLPDTRLPSPRWAALLAETEAAAAAYLIHCGTEPPALAPLASACLWLTAAPPAAPPPAVTVVTAPALLPLALADRPSRPAPASRPAVPEPEEERLSPQEALARLGAAGKVPDKLRRRLLGRADDP